MPKTSAGLLVYRIRDQLEVFLVHMGGPFWAKKDEGSWSIPKGEYEDEDSLAAAKREFEEETGLSAPSGPYVEMEPVHTSAKTTRVFAVAGDFDASITESNDFKMEWPPRSGRMQKFPEIDRAEWFPIEAARGKILESQRGLLDHLAKSANES